MDCKNCGHSELVHPGLGMCYDDDPDSKCGCACSICLECENVERCPCNKFEMKKITDGN